MDTNQVIEAVENNEEAIETATEAIAEAGWTGTDVAAGFGAGMLAGVLLAKFVLAPVYRKVKSAIRNRPPKEVKAKVKDVHFRDVEKTEKKEPETASGEEKPEEK